MISIAWGIGVNADFGIETTAEFRSNQTIYLGSGIFFLVASIVLSLAKPYRPDIEQNDDVKGNWLGKLSWWTGDPL